ncbi:hypothetical protein ADK47_02255 [Streptomyces rimosus subsp. rimosus]|nr:hypothetical protein ADK47_02255 [Streptomyces rimosus subsp. rimosus]
MAMCSGLRPARPSTRGGSAGAPFHERRKRPGLGDQGADGDMGDTQLRADGAVRRAGVGRGQGRQGGAFVGERGAGLVADTHRQFGVAGPADRFKGLLRGRIHDTTSLVTFTYQPW